MTMGNSLNSCGLAYHCILGLSRIIRYFIDPCWRVAKGLLIDIIILVYITKLVILYYELPTYLFQNR